MASVEQQVPSIIIRGAPRRVSPLEAHLRALQSQLQESAVIFSARLGLDAITYQNFLNHRYLSNTSIDNMGAVQFEEPDLINNPHARAIRTIVTKLHGRNNLAEKRRAEGTDRDKIALRRRKEKARAVLETGPPYEGTIIFRYEERKPSIDNGIETPDTRTENEKWLETLSRTTLGRGVKYIRCDIGETIYAFSKRTKIPGYILQAIENDKLSPTPDQLAAVMRTAPFDENEWVLPNKPPPRYNQQLLNSIAAQPTIGAAFRAMREWNHLSLREFASLLYSGSNAKQNISQLERDRTNLQELTMVNLLKKLGIDIHNPIMHIFLEKYQALQGA